MRRVALSPSLMCADFIELKRELDLFEAAGVEFLHLDIMDGHYVPNLTLGPDFCRRVGAYSPIPLDIHLMIEQVDLYAPSFVVAPTTWLCFHPEAVYHPLRTIELIRSSGAVPGIAIDPAVTVESVKHLVPCVSFVCVMTVNPGFAGQKLIPRMLDKITELRRFAESEGIEIDIEVDGNVSWEHIPKMVDAGADILVLGTSSLYDRRAPLSEQIERLRSVTSRGR